MLKAVIFDLDGVIVDTARFHYLAWKRLALEKFGYEFTEEQNEQFKGVNRIRCMEILNELVGGKLTHDEIITLANIKNDWYREYILNMNSGDVLPGALDFIKSCKDAGLVVSIASASKNTMLVLSRTGLGRFFDVVVDGNCVSKAKPDPEVFLIAAKESKTAAENCVVFEDSQAGILGAKSAGMKCVAVGDPRVIKGAEKYIRGLYEITVDEVKGLF